MIDKENEEIAELIREYHKKYNGLLGYRMMTDRINRDHNRNYSDKRIYKIMKILGIHSIIRPKRRSFTIRKNNNTAKKNVRCIITENITIQRMNLSKLLMIGYIITCMKDIREDSELKHHMKFEAKHYL